MANPDRMEKTIIHIPHASLNLPDIFYDKIITDKEIIEKENLFLSDYLVDKFVPENAKNIIQFGFSRLFCDVERFKDDKKESMSEIGMGVVYQKDHNGNTFIRSDDCYKDYIIANYYDSHHKKLDEKASSILKSYDRCYIIDLHSFSDDFVKAVFHADDNPDICIGYDEDFCDFDLIKITVEHFRSYGYTVKTNYPYSGSIIPNRYYDSGDSRIVSIMIEINKRIYLDNNETLNTEKYIKLKKCMDDYYKKYGNE